MGEIQEDGGEQKYKINYKCLLWQLSLTLNSKSLSQNLIDIKQEVYVPMRKVLSKLTFKNRSVYLYSFLYGN